LPIVLLSLRTCFKKDLDTSVAELVYDTTLKMPDKFFSSEKMPVTTNLHEDFCMIMRKLRPRSTTYHIKSILFFHRDLHNCSHVFFKMEGSRHPVDHSYTGSHKVLERILDKVFVIDVNGRCINITIDRLKSDFCERKLRFKYAFSFKYAFD